MAIFWFDPNKAAAGTGTFADPYGMLHTNNRPTVVNPGDECRVLGKPLSTLLTATEYTVTVRDFASNSSGSAIKLANTAQYVDFAQYDVVYFPEFDVFMRLAVTFNASGIATQAQFHEIPIVCGRDRVTTMRKVDPAQITTSAANAWYLLTNSTTAFPSGGVTATDCWINETTRITDGTVKTLLISAGTGSYQFLVSSVILALTNRQGVTFQRSTFDFSNTHILAGRSTNSATSISNYFPYADTTIKQIFSLGSSGSSVNCGGTTTLYAEDSSVTVDTLSTHSTFTLSGDSYFEFTVNKYINGTQYSLLQSGENFSQYAANAVINIGDVCAGSIGSQLVALTGANNTTYNLNGKGYVWSTGISIPNLIAGGGEFVLNYGPNFEVKTAMNALVQTNVTNVSTNIVYDSTTAPSSKEDYYNIPALPPGWAFVGTAAFATNMNPQQYRVSPLRAAIRSLNIKNLNVPTFFIGSSNRWTNVQVISVDNKFEPFEVLGIYNWQYVTIYNHTACFVASKDYQNYHTNAPSLKLELQTYTTNLWNVTNGADKPYSIKNIFIPTVQGQSYTISMQLRTDDTSYVAGDFSVHLCRNDGTVINSNTPTTAFINNYVNVTFTYTAMVSEEIYLAFKMHGYRAGQRYWVSDLVVS